MEIFNSEYKIKYGSLNSYMTAILVDIDIKNQKLIFTSAGHPAAVLLKDNQINIMKNTGKIIGILDNTKYISSEIAFISEDRLYIFQMESLRNLIP